MGWSFLKPTEKSRAPGAQDASCARPSSFPSSSAPLPGVPAVCSCVQRGPSPELPLGVLAALCPVKHKGGSATVMATESHRLRPHL